MIKGKALLVIDKLNSEWRKYDIQVIHQSKPYDPGNEVEEAFSWHDSMPAGVKKMEIGDRLRVLVSYELCFTTDYFGDVDAEMYLVHERVLRRQKYKYQKYSPKPYKKPKPIN